MSRRVLPLLVLVTAALAAVALMAAAWSSSPEPGSVTPGSTLETTLADPDGDGYLSPAPGEPLRRRQSLAPVTQPGRTLASFAQLSDLHIRDEESPARVPFLDRLGDPFSSTFRPHEALSAQVATAAVRALNALDPQAVVVTGDLIDSAQVNELETALSVLDGGRVRTDSGAPGYDGVQEATNPDPLYYRPRHDAPRHPGLTSRAQDALVSPGLAAPWLPVLGNHDLLVQGELAPDERLDAAATSSRAVVALGSELEPPDRGTDSSAAVRALLEGRIPARERTVPADPERRFLRSPELVDRLGGQGARAGRLDYSADIGSGVRAIVLDTVRRDGGSDGLVTSDQVAWLREELARASDRWVVVFAHNPLETSEGGEAALGALDSTARVAAVVSGHRHRNTIEPRKTAAGGYWLVGTSSLADFPQQSRFFQLRERAGGGAVLETWMVDHDGAGLAGTARELAFIDAQGGRPQGFAGRPGDRNAALGLPSPD